MRVFLTGASGYVGSHIAKELVSRRHEFVGLARKPSRTTTGLDTLEWFFADLAEFSQFEEQVTQANVIIHCAMNYSDSGEENSSLDADFVRQLQAKEKYFIYTGNLYSKRPESTEEFLEEPIPASDDWRLQQESSIMESDSRAAIIRLGFVYGGQGGYLWKMLPPEVISGLNFNEIATAYWPMVHVQDVATLFVTIAEQQATGVYHAYDGSDITARDIMRRLREIYPSEESVAQAPHDHIQSLLRKSIKTTNARSLATGWEPEFDNFEENAAQAYASYLEAL